MLIKDRSDCFRKHPEMSLSQMVIYLVDKSFSKNKDDWDKYQQVENTIADEWVFQEFHLKILNK